MNYRCCAANHIRYMSNEGRVFSHNKTDRLYGLMSIPRNAKAEVMLGYLAAITFLDVQIGRLLESLEKLNEINNTLIVVTSDHGMHVGDKGMWEKYTLFEETTRIPLVISHPLNMIKWGHHYASPVEAIDILPTILDLLNIQRIPVLCPRSRLCVDFDGRSLASIFDNINSKYTSKYGLRTKENNIRLLEKGYAITQMRRCLYARGEKVLSSHPEDKWSAICGKRNKPKGSLMGYSLRSKNFRYTIWLQYNHKLSRPDITKEPVEEELYSHRGVGVANFICENENLLHHKKNETNTDITMKMDDNDSDEIHLAHIQLRSYLLNYLKQSIYGMDDAIHRTVTKWSKVYRLDKNGRVKKRE